MNDLFSSVLSPLSVKILGAIQLSEKKNDFSGGEPNGTGLSKANFLENLEYLQVILFFVFTAMTGNHCSRFAFLVFTLLLQ